MTTKKIWFGNAEKMMWVNCPSTNITRGRARWQETGTYLNGGAFEKSSVFGHRKYSIDWNLMRSEEAAKIIAFYEGVYGQSPIQFVDPFAAKSNILPLHWSTPRLCAGGEAPTIGSSAPSTVTASNALGYPTQSAVFNLTGASTPSVQIPVPPGKNLYFGARGSASGTAAVSVTSSKGNPVIARNLATNPSFEAASGTVEVRRNLFPDPAGVVGEAVHWTPRYGWAQSALTGVTGHPVGITTARRLTAPAGVTSGLGRGFHHGGNMDVAGDAPSASLYPVAPGQPVTVSVWVRSSVAGRVSSVRIRFSDGAAWVGATASPPAATLAAGQWVRVSCTATAPATATRIAILTLLEVGTGGNFVEGETFDATGMLVEQSSILGAFFAPGLPSPDSDLTPSWTGTANASPSVLTGATVAVTASAASRAIVSSHWASHGTRSMRIIPATGSHDSNVRVAGSASSLTGAGVTFVAGRTYTVMARLRLAAPQTGALNVQARRIRAVGNTVAGWSGAINNLSTPAPNEAGVHEQRLTFTVPADAVWWQVDLFNGAWPNGGDVWWDDLAIIEGTYTGPWFDGSNPPSGYGAVWEGAANASTSVYRERTTAVLSPLTETEQTTMVLNDPGTVTVKLTGSGALTLNSMTATIGSAPPKSGVFRQGEGNTGLKFVGEPRRTGYSSVMDLESVSAEFVEVGAWQ